MKPNTPYSFVFLMCALVIPAMCPVLKFISIIFLFQLIVKHGVYVPNQTGSFSVKHMPLMMACKYHRAEAFPPKHFWFIMIHIVHNYITAD